MLHVCVINGTQTYRPMKMELADCSETSAYKIQTPGNHPEESIQHAEHGESLKSRISTVFQLRIMNISSFFIPPMVQQSLLSQSFLVFEALRSHSDTPHSVGLLWTSDVLSQKPLPHNTPHSRETSMSRAVFETAIPASERPQTHALYSAAAAIGEHQLIYIYIYMYIYNIYS